MVDFFVAASASGSLRISSILYLTCRGYDVYGVRGDGIRFSTFQVPTVSGAGLKFSDFSMGLTHQCGLLHPSGVMMCWGEGASGQLGDGLGADRFTPALLGGGYAGTVWISFQCGKLYTAAVDAAGKVFSWGLDSAGNLAQSVGLLEP
jgi:alpha-tubulin suppressor-like RCC1 family protein